MNWIYTNIGKMVANFIEGYLDFVGNIISNVFAGVALMNNTPMIQNAANYTATISVTILTLMGIKQIITVYILETDGDPDSDPLDLLVRTSVSLAVIGSNVWIFDELLRLSNLFASEIGAESGQITLLSHAQSLIEEATGGISTGPSIIFFIIAELVLLIGFLVFTIIAAIRGAELCLMKILCPIFAIDLVTTNKERWNSFITSYFVTFFYYGIQLVCFRMCMSYFMMVTVYSSDYLPHCAGWMILMIKCPKWLDKFAYTSGLKSGASGAGRAATSAIYMLAR